MTIDKTKQLLYILKWQVSAVSGQSYDKMNEIGQCQGFFFANLDVLVRIIMKPLTFVCRFKKNMKSVKEFKEIIRHLFLLFFLNPFYVALLLPTASPRSRRGEELRRQTWPLFETASSICNVVSFWCKSMWSTLGMIATKFHYNFWPHPLIRSSLDPFLSMFLLTYSH